MTAAISAVGQASIRYSRDAAYRILLRWGQFVSSSHIGDVLIPQVAKCTAILLQTDRFDRILRRGIVCLFIALLGGPSLLFAVLTVEWTVNHQEQTPEEWFRQIVRGDARRYSSIQHFIDQGVDVSHHFRFHFANDADIDAIITSHRLRMDLLESPLLHNGQPEWYTPDEIPPFPFGRAYSNYSAFPETYSLFVDHQQQVAYFVYMDF